MDGKKKAKKRSSDEKLKKPTRSKKVDNDDSSDKKSIARKKEKILHRKGSKQLDPDARVKKVAKSNDKKEEKDRKDEKDRKEKKNKKEKKEKKDKKEKRETRSNNELTRSQATTRVRSERKSKERLDKKRQTRPPNSSTKISRRPKESEVKPKRKKIKSERVCCICKDKSVKAIAGGPCIHVFSKRCLVDLLRKPIPNPHPDDNYLRAPTLGRCPECRAELRKFDMKNVKTGKRLFKRRKSITSAGINGKVYQPKNGDMQLAHFCFDPKKPYMDFKAGIRADETKWLLNDGSLIPATKRFDKGFHWDQSTRTFHGSLSWKPTTFHGAHRWDVILGFTRDYEEIKIGIIHERKERKLKKTTQVKDADLWRYMYPFDGRWKLLWTNVSGQPQVAYITVSNNSFQQGPYMFNLNFSNPRVPCFRWPVDAIDARAMSGANLKKKPLGPEIGGRIVWETTHPAFAEITWERETIDARPMQHVQHFGTSGDAYTCNVEAIEKAKVSKSRNDKGNRSKHSTASRNVQQDSSVSSADSDSGWTDSSGNSSSDYRKQDDEDSADSRSVSGNDKSETKRKDDEDSETSRSVSSNHGSETTRPSDPDNDDNSGGGMDEDREANHLKATPPLVSPKVAVVTKDRTISGEEDDDEANQSKTVPPVASPKGAAVTNSRINTGDDDESSTGSSSSGNSSSSGSSSSSSNSGSSSASGSSSGSSSSSSS